MYKPYKPGIYLKFDFNYPKDVKNRQGIVAKFVGYISSGNFVYEATGEVPYLATMDGNTLRHFNPSFYPDHKKKYWLVSKALEDIDWNEYCINDQWVPVDNMLMETE